MKNNKIVVSIFIFLISLLSLTYFFDSNRKYSLVESDLRNYLIEIYSIIPKVMAKNKKVNLNESLNKAIKEDNERLKQLLELNNTLTEFNYVNATIISRNPNYWLDNITIDKGSNDGVEKNDSVITTEGLIGKITMVNKNNSVVTLLTSKSNYYVSVSVNKSNGLIYDYDEKNKCLKVKGIDKMSEINIGDKVTTNGLGGMFPSGLYVGEVLKVENDNYDLSKIVYVDIKNRFNDIDYVVILGRGKK